MTPSPHKTRAGCLHYNPSGRQFCRRLFRSTSHPVFGVIPNPLHLLLVHAIPQFHQLAGDLLVAQRWMRLRDTHNLHLQLELPLGERLRPIVERATTEVIVDCDVN